MDSPSPIVVATGLWIAWFVAWLAASVWSSRSVVRPSFLERLSYGAPISFGCILLFHRWEAVWWLGRSLLPWGPRAAWTSVGILLLGLAITWWARLHLGRLWSGTVALKPEHAIIRSGPYHFTRHPIYSGILLAAAGTVLIQDVAGAIAGFALIFAGLLLKIRLEERLLISRFGADYLAYRAEVPALVPRLW